MNELSNYQIIFSKSNKLASTNRFINVNALKAGTKIKVTGNVKRGEMTLTVSFGNSEVKRMDFSEKEYEFSLDKAGSYRFTLSQIEHTGSIFIYKEK